MKRILDRRAAIVRTIGLCWLMAVFWAPSQVAAQNAVLRLIEAANPRVVLADGDAADPAALGIQLEGAWERGQWTGRVVHAGNRPVRLREIVLADIQHGLPGETPVYGEGFTMLAQTGGTLAAPVDEGFYPDRSHYKIPEPEGLRTVYGVMTLQNSATEHTVLAFGGCRKYVGRLSFDATRLRVSLDIESLEMKPGETWELEPFIVRSGPDRPKLLQQIADRLRTAHLPIHREPVPTGWCSWYCFGPNVSGDDIRGNLTWARNHFPELKYIQIDDGYQPWMGDWLETGDRFGGDVRGVIREIRDLGFEPAIWVAPFVASPQSKLFREHPDWFVKNHQGEPLRSDQIGFGGWRLGPWYVLDGTHPETQAYLEQLFHTLRHDWGCSYFKLDATYWGAIHGGHHHDPRATRVEAYRRGMEAIRRGAGDGFILGCNHPIWPSLGLIHGSRSSMDINRDWHHVSKTGRENLLRGWQNGQLWWNDPDCLVLNGSGKRVAADFGDEQFLFHATLIYATGGMLLTGDDMRTYGDQELSRLRRLYPPTGRCMDFGDTTFRVGRLRQGDHEFVALFNWQEQEFSETMEVGASNTVADVWTGESLVQVDGQIRLTLPPRSARLLRVEIERKESSSSER